MGVDEHEESTDEGEDGEEIPDGIYSLTGLSLSLGDTDATVTEFVHNGEVIFLLLEQDLNILKLWSSDGASEVDRALSSSCRPIE